MAPELLRDFWHHARPRTCAQEHRHRLAGGSILADSQRDPGHVPHICAPPDSNCRSAGPTSSRRSGRNWWKASASDGRRASRITSSSRSFPRCCSSSRSPACCRLTICIDRIVAMLSRVAPGDVVAIARQQFVQIARQPHVGVLTLSLLAALWSTSSGMTAIADTLNQAHRITERRSWWRVRLTALALTDRADGRHADRVCAGDGRIHRRRLPRRLARAWTAVPLALEHPAVAAGVHAGRPGDRLHLPLRA